MPLKMITVPLSYAYLACSDYFTKFYAQIIQNFLLLCLERSVVTDFLMNLTRSLIIDPMDSSKGLSVVLIRSSSFDVIHTPKCHTWLILLAKMLGKMY